MDDANDDVIPLVYPVRFGVIGKVVGDGLDGLDGLHSASKW